MKKKYKIAIILMSAAPLLANGECNIDFCSDSVIILSTSPIPSPSGYLSSWIFFSGASHGKVEIFAVQYFGEKSYKRIKYGALCQVDYAIGNVDGAIASGVNYLKGVNVVKHIECK